VRPPLGTVRSREIVSVERASSLPGAPEDDYTVLQFTTDFANRSEAAVETVILMQGDEELEVTGYFIR